MKANIWDGVLITLGVILILVAAFSLGYGISSERHDVTISKLEKLNDDLFTALIECSHKYPLRAEALTLLCYITPEVDHD